MHCSFVIVPAKRAHVMISSIALLLCILSFSLRPTTADHDWNYLMFSQSWPVTVCRVWKELNASRTCTFPKTKDAFSIHGIWPSTSGSSGPAFCNLTWPFDPKEIKPIESELNQGWINVEDGTATYGFWAHEWDKHGTCAASIEPLNAQIKYFSQGLQWLQKYQMSPILSEVNILPSDTKTYSQNDFYNAVKSKLGVELDINCLHYKGTQYLWELRICFSKTFELIDCKVQQYFKFINGYTFVSNCNSDGIFFSTPQSLFKS